jgi:hypothetical protein
MDLRLLGTCVSLLAVAGVAHAQEPATAPPPPPPPAAAPAPAPAPAQQEQYPWQAHVMAGQGAGYEEHDGFFLRLALGFGGGVWGPDSDSSVEFSGVSGGADIAIGGVIAENLALHATLFSTVLFDPEITVDGEVVETLENASLNGGGFGVGATYYVMPLNLYFSGSLGFGTAQLTFDDGTTMEEGETLSGYAVDFVVGKEWWVSSQWGIGAALQVVYINTNTANDDGRLSGTGVHLMFSATCN